MVQLTLIPSEGRVTLAELLRSLESRARRSDGARRYADAAHEAAHRRFASLDARPLTTAECRRVGDYFNGVVRRAVLMSRDADVATARRRLVVASIEADLLAAGWTRERARAEARRAVGEPLASEGAA